MKTPTATPFVALMVMVLAFAGACSSGGGTTNTTTPPATTASTSGGSVTITMADFTFTPSTVSASTSQDIVLVNNGSALHNFSIDTTDISIDVQPGQTQTLTAPGPTFAAGTYSFFCKYHKASGMVGTLNATGG